MLQTLYSLLTRIAPFLIKVVAVFSNKIRNFHIVQVKANADLAQLKDWREKNIGSLVWIHCASLGEFEQGRPIIESLKKLEKPPLIALTFFSSSGYEIRKNYAQADWVGYLPLDHVKKSAAFIHILKPKAAVFVKYEFWPYYILGLKKLKIPLYGISVIIREGHFLLKPFAGFFRYAVSNFTEIFVQNEDSKLLFEKISINQTIVAGDTRFDTVVKNVLEKKAFKEIEKWKGDSKILILGSSWPEDEIVVLKLLYKVPGLKIIIVPHEINNDAIEKLKTEHNASLFSDENLENSNSKLLIINKIGILSNLYQYADFAFIGGAYGKGLHNILEAATYGLPLFFGDKNYKKFKEAEDLLALKVANVIATTEELEEKIIFFLLEENKLEKVQKMALSYVNQNAGATDIILKHLSPHLK
jgi:3-deoxy-D-manno-octulosonic-acid transferase